MSRASQVFLALLVLLGSYAMAGGTSTTLALFRDTETVASTFTTAASFDTTPPVVASSVISKTTPYVPGFIRQAGAYYVYANVTDAGGSGIASVAASVANVTTGSTAVPLVAGTYSIGGVSYTHRSASLTANAVLSAGAKSYTITARDGASNATTPGAFSVTVDNTAPAASAIATANGGSIVGRPEQNDTVTFTFTEPMEPQSILNGWTGTATSVVVRITNAAGGDTLEIANAANSALLPFGSVNLGGTGYVGANRTFGASGTASTMTMSGSSVTIVLGTASAAGTTHSGNTTMSWTPSATATDRAGNACSTTVLTEAGPADVEF